MSAQGQSTQERGHRSAIQKESRTNEATTAQKQALIHAAGQHNLKVIDVPGDGNCGLHAIAHQLSLHGTQTDPKTLRRQAVIFLRDHPQLLSENFLLRHEHKSVDSYLSAISVDGTWVDEITIRAVGACIQRNIEVLHDNGHITSLKVNELEAGNATDMIDNPPIKIGLIGEMHYVSLVHMGVEKEPQVADEPETVKGEEKKEEDPCSASQRDWPSVWSEDTWHKKKERFKFLECRDGNLGCASCRRVVGLQTFSGPGRFITEKWANCRIQPNGKGRPEQLRSLRKKLFEHTKSESHVSAEIILKERQEDSMTKSLEKMCAVDEEMTSKAFRTAYYIAKNDRPFHDYYGLLELQEVNGSEIAVGLRSRFTAKEIVVHVAQQMIQRACHDIIKNGHCISVLIDESTTVSNKSTLVVYLKCMSSSAVKPHFMFLQLIELEDQSADTIVTSLLQCLNNYGFTDDYLKTHFISFASDGASVMTGQKAGVASRLASKYPNIIPWHCLNHRLELAVGDAVDDVRGLNHFKSFMDSLYVLYSRSPKAQKQLEAVAHNVNLHLKKIGRVLNTRWVSSSFRTVAAVWQDLEALAGHFREAADPKSKHYDSANANKYVALRKKLCSPQFISDVAVMYDSLEELKLLSESLQHRDMTVPQADKLIHRSIRRLLHMKDKPGPKMTEAKSCAESSTFGATKLESNAKHIAINIPQFLTSLADNLRQRLLVSDHVSATTDTTGRGSLSDEQLRRKKLATLLSHLTVLDSTFWPSIMDTDYGENEIRQLCQHFRLPYGPVRDAYCDYRESGGKHIAAELQTLLNCVSTIPCSTAECERAFSAMNLIITDIRSSLLIKHVSSLMFIKLHGPPLADWKPSDYVKSWLLKHRAAGDSRTRVAAPTDKTLPDPLWSVL